MDIRDVIARRSDLGTFLVHLTRDEPAHTSAAKLGDILQDWRIEARSMFGAARDRLIAGHVDHESQRCVCFTETPLEYVSVHFEPIDNRAMAFGPYGVAIPKKISRRRAVNPVWYIDITPAGHDWLMNPINAMIDAEMAAGAFPGTFIGSRIARLAPFIEQMGTHAPPGVRKEFWWEREWRHVGHFVLPNRVMVLCPENEFAVYRAIVAAVPGRNAAFIDPRWGLDQIVSRLSGYSAEETDIL